MALTPDDVLNKRFQTTKFRDGYEQDEVDDFLDEVVVEFRRLSDENESLKAKAQEADELKSKLARAEAEIKMLRQSRGTEAAPAAVAATAPAAAAPTTNNASNDTEPRNESDEATSLLQLARTLHDQHVREGEETKEKTISEARAEARRILTEVQDRKTKELNDLTQRKTTLEADIKDLETFERQYRSSLKSFISGQLKDLESSGSIAESTTKSVHGSSNGRK